MTADKTPTDAEIATLYTDETGFALGDSPAALLAKWGTPAPVGVEPVASKSHGAWDGIEDVLDMPDGTDLYTADQVLAMGRVPPGWTAVPVEPTDAMVRAMAAQFCGTVDVATCADYPDRGHGRSWPRKRRGLTFCGVGDLPRDAGISTQAIAYRLSAARALQPTQRRPVRQAC